jgi:uncharacterized protein YceH (UPF0502 family)
MEIPAWFTDKDFEKRIIQLEERIDVLESEVKNLKSKLDSHYIE